MDDLAGGFLHGLLTILYGSWFLGPSMYLYQAAGISCYSVISNYGACAHFPNALYNHCASCTFTVVYLSALFETKSLSTGIPWIYSPFPVLGQQQTKRFSVISSDFSSIYCLCSGLLQATVPSQQRFSHDDCSLPYCFS